MHCMQRREFPGAVAQAHIRLASTPVLWLPGHLPRAGLYWGCKQLFGCLETCTMLQAATGDVNTALAVLQHTPESDLSVTEVTDSMRPCDESHSTIVDLSEHHAAGKWTTWGHRQARSTKGMYDCNLFVSDLAGCMVTRLSACMLHSHRPSAPLMRMRQRSRPHIHGAVWRCRAWRVHVFGPGWYIADCTLAASRWVVNVHSACVPLPSPTCPARTLFACAPE
jgi:hypothetical protein